MRKAVPTGSEQMLMFEFLASGAQFPFFVRDDKKVYETDQRMLKKKQTYGSTLCIESAGFL